MAQNYGAAQPIYDVFKNASNKVEGLLGDSSAPVAKKAQTMNWKPEANEEQKEQIGGRKKLTADGPTLGGKKKAKAKTQKATARKRD